MATKGRQGGERGGQVLSIAELDLSAEMREQVLGVCSAQVAINVYREIQRMQLSAEVAAAGCNVAGNCSSCSK